MFPDDRTFAFTILDDTDDSTVENVAPMYELLERLGFRTTKTVWPVDCPEGSENYFAGHTLQDPAYLRFVQDLERKGFEVASHCATMESSLRERTRAGLDFYNTHFLRRPTVHVNHGQNRENLYWGAARYHSFLLSQAARLFERWRGGPQFEGHIPESRYFWGDLCQLHFRFVRSFTFHELDMARVPPGRPYRLDATPYVTYWFATADAPDVAQFRRLVRREAVDRLMQNGGYTIISTHLGKGFVRDGYVDPAVEDALRYVSSLPGWFVPVSTLLDFLCARAPTLQISARDLSRLEFRHVRDRIRARLRR